MADWRERMYAYRLSDGRRDPDRDIYAGAVDTDPSGLWGSDGLMLSTGWEGDRVRAFRMPGLVSPGPGVRAGVAADPGIAESGRLGTRLGRGRITDEPPPPVGSAQPAR